MMKFSIKYYISIFLYLLSFIILSIIIFDPGQLPVKFHVAESLKNLLAGLTGSVATILATTLLLSQQQNFNKELQNDTSNNQTKATKQMLQMETKIKIGDIKIEFYNKLLNDLGELVSKVDELENETEYKATIKKIKEKFISTLSYANAATIAKFSELVEAYRAKNKIKITTCIVELIREIRSDINKSYDINNEKSSNFIDEVNEKFIKEVLNDIKKMDDIIYKEVSIIDKLLSEFKTENKVVVLKYEYRTGNKDSLVDMYIEVNGVKYGVVLKLVKSMASDKVREFYSFAEENNINILLIIDSKAKIAKIENINVKILRYDTNKNVFMNKEEVNEWFKSKKA